jgi:tRNA dimethylallyltransferase
VKTLCLAGPTASGKSALVLQAARQLRGEAEFEVISVDSAQVYRGMDIGTAKPSAEERAELAHHLIDIVEPEQAYSAARFIEDATLLVQQIRARGRLPLLVGGTMLYFKALRDGLHGMPGADAALRSELDRRAAAEGWPALHAELACVDAPTAARLAPNDAQRIQRALEVWLLSGKPLSAWQAETPLARSDRWTLLSLEPSSREWLHRRIETRFAAMLDAGFVDEVRGLRRRPGLSAELPSMRSVGYRQAWAALDNDDYRACANAASRPPGNWPNDS